MRLQVKTMSSHHRHAGRGSEMTPSLSTRLPPATASSLPSRPGAPSSMIRAPWRPSSRTMARESQAQLAFQDRPPPQRGRRCGCWRTAEPSGSLGSPHQGRGRERHVAVRGPRGPWPRRLRVSLPGTRLQKREHPEPAPSRFGTAAPGPGWVGSPRHYGSRATTTGWDRQPDGHPAGPKPDRSNEEQTRMYRFLQEPRLARLPEPESGVPTDRSELAGINSLAPWSRSTS